MLPLLWSRKEDNVEEDVAANVIVVTIKEMEIRVSLRWRVLENSCAKIFVWSVMENDGGLY